MTLWILFGLVTIALLGFVCAWILKARGGLEVEHQADPGERSLRPENARRGGG